MDKKYIDLLVSITGLEKEFITNSLKNDEGNTIVLNQFRDKNKVFKISDFELREKNLKEDHNSTYLNELIDLAKVQKLPNQLYNAAANNIISAQNKKLGADLGIEMEDFSNTENFVKSVKEKLTTVDNKQLQTDFDAQAQTIKDFDKKFEDQETTHNQEMKQNKIDIISNTGLNKFSKNIDFETEDELKKRISVAQSMFNSLYDIDIVEEKTLIKDKKGNVLKHDETKEPLTIDVIFDTEISKYVPVKKERDPSERKPGDPIINTGVTTRESIDKKIESGEIKPHSKEHIELEKMIDQK